MPDMKLLALDADDLAILSAHLQDAVLRVGDIAFIKADRRFALVLNRFDWHAALSSQAAGRAPELQRRRSGVRFEKVRAAQAQGLDPRAKDAALELLALVWEQTGEGPGGYIVLQFAGGGAIRLDVECIEVELRDLGAAWAARSKPTHDTAAATAPATSGKQAK